MPESDIEIPAGTAPALPDRLDRIPAHTAVTCSPTTAIRDALASMRRLSIGSIIVADAEHRPLGILTLRDVVDRIVFEAGALDEPIARFMTPQPVCVPVGASAYQAALLMVRHGVRHLVLVEGERVAGVVSERDLFGMQTTGVRHLSLAIKSATDLPAVEAFGREIGELARRMVLQGAAIGPLTAFISSLIDLLTERIVDLEMSAGGMADARVCWIVMGSEGRGEQTLVTDQDNGIVFEVDGPESAEALEAMRARLLPIAQRINRALDRAGYKLCPGDIMAGNPRWCLSSAEWRARFSRWIDSGSPEALLHGSIFFDLRPLTGATGLATDLRTWLLAHASKNRRFLHQMAANALRNRPPLGMIGRFALDEHGGIDLKMNGVTPFVDAGRIFSLGCAIDEVRTEARLRSAGTQLRVPGHEVEAWIAAFYQIQAHRLRRQVRCLEGAEPPDNRLDPRALNDFDQQVLKLAFEQARTLQSRLAIEYGL